VPAY
jgi:hypothetical protein